MRNIDDGEHPTQLKQLICSICHLAIEAEPLSGWRGGHNAQPINDGRCCNDCNSQVVIPARIRRAYEPKRKTVIEL